MADAIGQLGLDTKDFEQAIDRSTEKLKDMALAGSGTHAAMLGIAAGAVVAAKGIYEASKAAADFQQKLDTLVGSGHGSALTTSFSDLNKQIASAAAMIDEMSKPKGAMGSIWETLRQGLNDMSAESYEETGAGKRDAQQKELLDKIAATQGKIAEKIREQNEVLDLQLSGQKEAADIKKVELEYAEKIADAQKNSTVEVANELKLQRDKTIELIKQKELQEYAKGVVKEEADNRKKDHIDRLKNDKEVNDEWVKSNKKANEEYNKRKESEGKAKLDFEENQKKEFEAEQKKKTEDKKDFEENQKKEFEAEQKKKTEDKKDFEENQKLQFQAQQADEAKARADRMDAASDAISAQESAIDKELMTPGERREARRSQEARDKAGRKINTRKQEADKVAEQNKINRPDIFKGEDPRNDGIFDSDKKPGEKARGENGSAGRNKDGATPQDTGQMAVDKLTRIVTILEAD